ncbi:MAG: MotA/TolQ/ExbB proton channel family protein [Verrucomicrobia bacterium]|nr:MotA/TolQ/ExbB proton channel family protein [Verrucomicrobiota bacterium]MCH8528091.1 MotA/TolQ/ExbB proton channel family protein [Kiritimatiellia bacterium]
MKNIRFVPIFVLLALIPPASFHSFAQEPSPPTEVSDSVPADTITGIDALTEKLRGSGKTGMALFVISIVGFSFAFDRLYHLRKSKITPAGLAAEADKCWNAGDIDGLKTLASQSNSTLGRAILVIADHRDSPRADVTTMAGDTASREIRYHLQWAYPLAVVATISPLLGLFGTVYGMIGAFESVALAGEMGDPSIMAGDISFALITTALGLVIAVPALACYHFFRVRTHMLALGLEGQLSHLISRWFALPPAGATTIEPGA